MRLRTKKGPAADGTAAHARQRARQRATELWETGQKEESLEVLRRARLEHGPDSWMCFAYGTRAMQLGHGWAAREALHDAVDLDATNLDALEFFIEADSKHPAPEGSVVRVLTALADALPARPGVDADALAFLLPAMERVPTLASGVRSLGASKDEVARRASRLALEGAGGREGPCASVPDSTTERAELLVLLGKGESTRACEVMASMHSEELPVRSLRIAIRRELSRGRDSQTIKLLELYRRAKPEDAWSQAKLTELSTPKPLTHYQLATEGFPFSARKEHAVFEPVRKRALYVVHNSLPHHSVGYATRTHGLLRGIRAQGWDIHGVTRLGYPYDMPGYRSLGEIEPRIEVDGVPYHRLSTAPGTEPKNPIQPYVERYAQVLGALASEQRPFVIHAASNHWNGLAAIQTARRLGIPSVYEVRGLWEVTRGSRDPVWMDGVMYRYMARMEADAAKYATRVIAITSALKEELMRRGVDEGKICLVPNGVETSRFEPRPRQENLAARLGVAGKTVVGYVGSMLDYEGLDLLIDAAAVLHRERTDVAFVLVGDGAELPRLRERVEEKNLGSTVLFTGRVPHHEVEDYYSVIDICPFPRLPLPVCEMVSPLKPFEAMAMGKTVVVSDVRALAEVVTDGETGLVHRKGDAQSLAERLRTLLEDESLRRRLSEGGLEWVRAERDWSDLAKRVSDVYEELGGRR